MFCFSLWLVFKLSSNVLACLIFYVVMKYLKRKPLGMQTVLDLMILDYMKLSVVGFVTSSLVYIKFTDKYSHEAAMMVMHLTHFTVTAILFQIMAYVIIRYVYVFYPGIAHETSDKKIMKVTRFFCAIGAFVSEFVDDFEGVPEYHFLRGTKKMDKDLEKPTLVFFKGLLVIVLLVIIFTQARIEMFKKLRPTSPNRNRQSMFKSPTIAIMLVMMCIALLVILEWAFSPASTDDSEVVKTLRSRAIWNLISTLFLPLVMMKKNKKFQNYCLSETVAFYFRHQNHNQIQPNNPV